MDRLTQREAKRYTVSLERVEHEGTLCTGSAVDRLGRYEDLHEWLLAEKAKTEEELEGLRREGRQQTVRFKQLLAQKLTLGNTLAMFEVRGL